jgi:hypothetical protein
MPLRCYGRHRCRQISRELGVPGADRLTAALSRRCRARQRVVIPMTAFQTVKLRPFTHRSTLTTWRTECVLTTSQGPSGPPLDRRVVRRVAHAQLIALFSM